jgi:hypothetical protein
MAVAIAAIAVVDVAIRAVGRGACFDTAKIDLAAATETMQSGSPIKATTRDVARRCAGRATGRKASNRSGRRATEGRTTSTEARRRAGEEGWGTRSRRRRSKKLRECGIGRDDGGAEQHAHGQGEKSLCGHRVSPSI